MGINEFEVNKQHFLEFYKRNDGMPNMHNTKKTNNFDSRELYFIIGNKYAMINGNCIKCKLSRDKSKFLFSNEIFDNALYFSRENIDLHSRNIHLVLMVPKI
jgi:hypothetical protein